MSCDCTHSKSSQMSRICVYPYFCQGSRECFIASCYSVACTRYVHTGRSASPALLSTSALWSEHSLKVSLLDEAQWQEFKKHLSSPAPGNICTWGAQSRQSASPSPNWDSATAWSANLLSGNLMLVELKPRIICSHSSLLQCFGHRACEVLRFYKTFSTLYFWTFLVIKKKILMTTFSIKHFFFMTFYDLIVWLFSITFFHQTHIWFFLHAFNVLHLVITCDFKASEWKVGSIAPLNFKAVHAVLSTETYHIM